MYLKVGDTIHHIPEVFAVKSVFQVGDLRVEGTLSRLQLPTLCPLSLARRADIDETGLAAVRDQNVTLRKERSSLFYQLEGLRQEVSSLQRKAEVTMGQLQLPKDFFGPPAPTLSRRADENNLEIEQKSANCRVPRWVNHKKFRYAESAVSHRPKRNSGGVCTATMDPPSS